MTDETMIYIDDKWFKKWFEENIVSLTFSGLQTKVAPGENHKIDPRTGFWARPRYSSSTPPRWLYHIEPDGAGWKAVNPTESRASNIGGGGWKQVGAVFRLLPLVRQKTGGRFQYPQDDSLEVKALFVFHGAAPQGGPYDAFKFNLDSGEMKRKSAARSYLLAGLLGVKPRDHEVEVSIEGAPRPLTYGKVIDALAADITVAPEGRTAGPIPVYDLSEEAEFERLKKDIFGARKAAGLVDPSGGGGGHGS